MRDLPKVFAFYSEIDAPFESQRSDANARGAINVAEKIEEKQVINDQAYFVLCWGQLESEINDKCRDLIRSERSGRDWATRRVWELFDPHDRRLSGLSFEDRTALLLDKNGGQGSPWALVMRYYAVRNEIAHGKLRSTRLDVSVVVEEFFSIQAELHK